MIAIVQHILSYISPQTLEKRQSKINGQIIVEKFFGHNRLVVDGFWQSGVYATDVMKTLISKLHIAPSNTHSVLLLGLGGGSVLQVFQNTFPNMSITAVEIDKNMIDLGMKYLKSNFKNMRIYVGNAKSFIYTHSLKKKYKIILVDLFIGCKMPEFVQSRKFLLGIHKLLEAQGVFVCNASYIDEYKRETDELVHKVQKLFRTVEIIHRKPNLIIHAFK